MKLNSPAMVMIAWIVAALASAALGMVLLMGMLKALKTLVSVTPTSPEKNKLTTQ